MDIANVTRTAFDLLKERIITGELKPRQKLSETGLSLQLGISRPPLREAFRLLEKDHFVINIPRKGTYVVGLSINDYLEISQIRKVIECYAIDYLKAAKIRNLPDMTESLKRASGFTVPANSDNPELILNHTKVMLDFHIRLVETAGNSRLNSIYNSINVNLLRYQFIYFNYRSSTQHSLDDHMNIVKAIQSGDYDHAKKELIKHIGFTMKVVKKKISDTSSIVRAE